MGEKLLDDVGSSLNCVPNIKFNVSVVMFVRVSSVLSTASSFFFIRVAGRTPLF